MDILCEVCGDIGFRHLLLCCGDCKHSAIHQYCLEKVVFDASLIEWFCYECLQRRGEVTCIRSLEKVPSERPSSNAHFGSIVHQPITKRVESARDAVPWRNRKRKSFVSKYASHNKIYSPRKKHAKNKSNMPYSPNDGCEEVFSCSGIKNIPSVQDRSADSIDTSSISQHDITEPSESSERFTEYQKGSSYPRGKNLKMAAASSSSEESGEDIPSENVSLASDDLQSPLGADYVLSYRTYLSKAQKVRVMTLIQEIQPEFTVYIATMRKTSVQPPGPYLGITKEYALAHCPDRSTTVTLEMPGKNKKWHPKFYKRDESRKNFLMGQWLDFVRDNHVQEGDIVLLLPTKGGNRSIFTVYLLHETATHSSMASEVHIEEPTTGEHASQESGTLEIPHESLESEDSDSLFLPPYFVPCKNLLSKSQKRIVEERVRAIRSEVPLCVAVMKNNNVGVAQRWMLCGGKTWEAKMMFHNGRRWFINGGWPNFARGNGLRVGDICLFELKKEEKLLTMAVHIIRKELF
ncbi:hypothetical protein SETIT_9G166800v2 [Setaria italica]|uniref:TF-B3 domain-containing protein n=1 Tax=Setaria italica TaxID=4555 RepID=A0A368SJ59_SETIT|nr:hypothetical protein SETIT_9G166800v2 [Setaria italica]